MRRLLQILAAFIVIFLSVCAFPNMELGRGNLFYFAAYLFLAFGLYFVFSRSERFRKHAFAVAIATTVSLFAGYCICLKTINNSELAEFFQVGNSCTSVLEIIPVKNIKFIVETSENVCLISALKETLKNVPLDDARRKISTSAELLKSHQRLHVTEMTLLLAVQVLMHAKHNGIQKSEQEKRILYFAEDTVNLLEIYPLPSTVQGPDSISFVAEQSRKLEPSLLVMMVKNARNTIASRMPASSVARTDSSGEWRGLELRVKKAQEAWNITDADLKKLSN